MEGMKQLVTLLAVLTVLLVGSPLKAETLQTSVGLSSLNLEGVPFYSYGGLALITIVVDRDPNGRVLGGVVTFWVTGSVIYPNVHYFLKVTGLNIQEGPSDQNGPVVITTALNENNSPSFEAGDFKLDNIPSTSIDVEALKRLLKSPAGFYVNLTTALSPVGGVLALRGQIAPLMEPRATTVNLSPANLVMGAQGPNPGATATATITAHPARNAETGSVSGGFVNFTVTYDFGGPVTITGLDLHEAASGQNGPIIIRAGVSEGNPVVSQTGKGTINLSVPLTTAAGAAFLDRLLGNPAAFYVNLRTSASPEMRAQLASLSLPPVILAQNETQARPVNSLSRVGLNMVNIDLASNVVVNGQPVPSTGGGGSGYEYIKGEIPASLAANPGVLVVQVQNAQGVRSEPINIVLYSSLNSTKVVPVDAARFRSLLARDSICAAFGSGLSTNTVSASSTPLPTSLDGTSVYVNGLLTPLFFVSPTQVNFQIPYITPFRGVEVVVIARDGTASIGYTFGADTAPAIFTRLANGQGAPAAYASADGVNFNIEVSNADGSAAAVNAGVYVSLYGTGIRYTSGPVLVSIGGTSVKAMFAGPQGTFVGLDQVNFQIPTSLAGKGEVEMLIYVDGEASNAVKLNIR